jgi:saccharopine dehydrogenase-like NADP-dependent oxidoreductase
MKTVIVLGGAGAMSQVTIHDLLHYNKDIKVIIADMNIDQARQRVKELKTKRITAEFINLDDKKNIRKVIKKGDLVMNCALSKYNLSVMEAALETKTNYMDLSALPMTTLEQMRLDQDFRKANLTAIIGIGAAPGISNLMARYAYDHLDQVEIVRMRYATKSFIKSSLPIKFPYTPYGFLGQLENKSIVLDQGELKEVDSLTGEEYVEFPEPIGAMDVVYLSHPEPASMSVTFREKGIQNIDAKIHVPIEFRQKVQLLWDLGFASSIPLKFKNKDFIPREVLTHLISKLPMENLKPIDCGCYKITVIGKRDGERQEYTMEFISRSQGAFSSTAVRTGTPISLAAQMFFNGEITQKGAFPPDVCISPKDFFKKLAARNLFVSLKVKIFI